MKSYKDWHQEKNIGDSGELNFITREKFTKLALEYFGVVLKGNLKTYFEHKKNMLIEAVETSRYGIEVNYRTKKDEVLEGFAKVTLGYVSAALKNAGYHTKHVFTEKPLRLLISTRNWDDGEWAGVVTWNAEHSCFVISKGFYNRERKTVSIQTNKKCDADNAAEIAKELNNMMHHLKDRPDRHQEKLKPVPLKRGPKR
jgi:hypothetical protein